jgi:manganese oxidase
MGMSRPHLLLVALLLSSAEFFLHAQNQAIPQQVPDAPLIEPTVTPEAGDVGGKFFGKAPDPKKTRHYYIAAEPVLWDFAPEGRDSVCGKLLPPDLLLNRHSWKVRYVQYADEQFSVRILPTERLGILGPVLRGVAGEYLAVTFLNRGWLPLSMHPHGVKYDKDSEGSYYKPSPGRGAAVAPGARFTYVWHLDETSAPRAGEPSSKAWLYHSHVTGEEEINQGLIGTIIVTDPARARADGTPADVDREMAVLFLIFNEASLGDGEPEEADERPVNTPEGPVQRTWSEVQEIVEQGERHTINGRVFGNLGGLEMNEGERVRWYVFGLGSEKDFHTAHWHGESVIENNQRRTDVIELLPGSMKIADMQMNNPGTWLLHCHVGDHMSEGMFTRYIVQPKDGRPVSRDPEAAFFGMPQAAQTLRIQAAEVVLPHGGDQTGEINLTGQVTVPDPFSLAKNELMVQLGRKILILQPDASGICVSPDGILLVKNTSQSGNGNVVGGTLNFELTLKGAGWMQELRQLKLLTQDKLVQEPSLKCSIKLGPARHEALVVLKNAVH